MNIVIANRQRSQKINARFLKQLVREVFANLAITEAELGISLVADREMTLVNETFLQHEGSTDVITFDHGTVLEPFPKRPRTSKATSKKRSPQPVIQCQTLHGELFVCVDQAVQQAREFKTTWQSEVVRYVVHGILHLVGYDDLKAPLRRQMKREENRLVNEISGRFELRKLDAQTSKPARF